MECWEAVTGLLIKLVLVDVLPNITVSLLSMTPIPWATADTVTDSLPKMDPLCREAMIGLLLVKDLVHVLPRSPAVSMSFSLWLRADTVVYAFIKLEQLCREAVIGLLLV